MENQEQNEKKKRRKGAGLFAGKQALGGAKAAGARQKNNGATGSAGKASRRGWIVGTVVGGSVAIAGAAFAAALVVNAGSLASGTGTVGSCDTSVTTAMTNTAYDPTLGEYASNQVTVGDINPACFGQRIDVTVALENGTIASTGFTFVGESPTAVVAINPTVRISEAQRIAVLISDAG